MNAIEDGFPVKIDKYIPILHPFFKCKLNFSVLSQDTKKFLIYHDSDLRSQMVVPKLLWNKLNHVLHANHRRDLVRVKQRAQQHLYWPNMTSDLKAFIEQCKFCQINMPSHPKESLIPSEAPSTSSNRKLPTTLR